MTNIYSLEYDGFTDFPRYPLNFLSDLNAVLGIAEIHGTYLNGGSTGAAPRPNRSPTPHCCRARTPYGTSRTASPTTT